MPTLTFGAIDVGSNAARLLIASQEYGNTEELAIDPKQVTFVRVPLRLGEDVFRTREVSPERVSRLLGVMRAFKELLQVCDVAAFRACATAALREAQNSPEIIARIAAETNITLEIIGGHEEARIICESHLANRSDFAGRFIYVDVGGGSTECTLIENRKMCESRSFNIGALRSLAGTVADDEYAELDSWLLKIAMNGKPHGIIGSGGGIFEILNLARPAISQKIGVEKLREIHQRLSSMSVHERIHKLGLRPDRADVIEPAAALFLHIAEITDAAAIHVPSMGLADGIIHNFCRTFHSK